MEIGEVTISGLSLGGIFGGTRLVTLNAEVSMTNTNPFTLYLEESTMEVYYPTTNGDKIGTLKVPQVQLEAKTTEKVTTQTRLVDFPPPGDDTLDLIRNNGINGDPLVMYTTGESQAFAQVKVFNWYAALTNDVTCKLETYLTEPTKDSQECVYKPKGQIEIKTELPEEFKQQ